MQSSRAWLVAGATLVLLGIAPLLMMVDASIVARANGCAPGEGVHACRSPGRAWDVVLYAIDGLGSLELATMWLGFMGLIALTIGSLRHLHRHDR